MEPKKKIVLVTGMPGSGKSLVSKFLESKGYKSYSMGDIVRQIAEERGVEKTSENLLAIAKEIRMKMGPAGVAKLLVKKLEKEPHDRIVIDGLRSVDEARVFASLSECLHIVSVHASPWTRYQRLVRRGRPGDPKSWEDFVYRDRVELSFGLGKIIAISDIVVLNEGEVRPPPTKLEEIMGVLEKCPKELELKYL